MKLFHLEHKWQALSPLLQVPFRVQSAAAQILLELNCANTLTQEALYITLSEKHTSYNFVHYVTSRYNIKSFWNEFHCRAAESDPRFAADAYTPD